MSKFNHSICDKCWKTENGTREPCKMIDAEPDVCCFCGKEHRSGIFIRRTLEGLKCFGVHPDFLRESARMWRLIRDFVMCETSQTSYTELKGSQSMDIPVEFLALCEFAEEMGVKLP